MNSETEKLRKEIQDAFAWRPYPGDEELGLRRPDFPRYKDWRELSLEVIRSYRYGHTSLMAFMSCQGFVYYLPAFLVVALEVAQDFDSLSYDITETLLFYLTNPDYFTNPDYLADLAQFNEPLVLQPPSAAVRDHFVTLISCLTPREKLAVIHVLEFLVKEYERHGESIADHCNTPHEALASYWGKLREEDLQGPQEEK